MRGEYRSMRSRDWAARVVMGFMVAVIAGACASGDGAKRVAGTPIESVASIAGTWTGTLEFGAGEQSCTLTIEPGGHAVLQGRTITAHGSVSVNQGKGAYSFPGRSEGTLTLYQDGGKREMQLKGTSGVFDARVTPK
jgi:hypothetical protein